MRLFDSFRAFLLVTLVAGGRSAIAQDQSSFAVPSFAVASVRVSGPEAVTNGPHIEDIIVGGPGTSEPERIGASRITLHSLMMSAFGVSADQISGPGWLQTEKYDIAAELPPGSTRVQMQSMLQNLLRERFKLAVHHDVRELPAWKLIAVNGGSKLHATRFPDATPLRPGEGGVPLPVDRDGFPIMPNGRSGGSAAVSNGVIHYTYQAFSIANLIGVLSRNAAISHVGSGVVAPGRIVDATGLTGRYDFHLEYSAGRDPASDDVAPGPTGPDVFEALEQQLGLRLQAVKTSVAVIVVDQAVRVPTEN